MGKVGRGGKINGFVGRGAGGSILNHILVPEQQGLLLKVKGRIPLLASPQGGVAASSRISAKPPKPTQTGWFSFDRSGNLSSSLSKEAPRHFLIGRTPLLAVMQGGEYASAG